MSNKMKSCHLHLVLDKYDMLDHIGVREDVLELWQELVRCDDVCGLGLVEAVHNSLLAQIGVQGDDGEALLEAPLSGDEPLAPGVGKDANLVSRLQIERPHPLAEELGSAVRLLVRQPPLKNRCRWLKN